MTAAHDNTERSAAEIAADVRAGRRSAGEESAAALDRIARLDPHLRAFISVEADAARAQAARVDERLARGERDLPLAGVPVALKDNICTTFSRTTCASRILADYRSPFDAHVVERLRDAGAVLVGKTNLDEFAMGSSTENSSLFPTRNPWNSDYVPGGSSGGSVVAVAAGMVPLALGSDTGGSVRQPAALCGAVGLKPTYGRVSRYGLVAYGSSLDQIGPIARSAADAALLLGVIAGRDDRDSTCVDRPIPDYPAQLDASLGALTIGIPEEYFGDGLDPDVRRCVEAAIAVLHAHGATTRTVHLPHLKYNIACYYLVATAEASSNLARFDGIRYGHRSPSAADIHEVYSRSREEGFGPEVKRRIMLGTYALSSGYHDRYYLRALKVRTLIRRDFERAFADVDLIAGPTSPTAGFRLGERCDDPLAMYLADIYTVSANLAGIPAVSIPCGFGDAGLPVGLQLMAPHFAEDRLLRVAHEYQRHTDWHTRRPPLRVES